MRDSKNRAQILAAIAFVAFAFAMSSFDAQDSSAMSSFVRSFLHLDFVPMFVIRKFAHLFEFSLIGAALYRVMDNWKIVALCLICAIFDEFHQIFVLGRSAQILDVAIDTLGATLGLIIRQALYKRNHPHSLDRT